MPEAFALLRDDARAALTAWQAPTDALEATRARMLDVLEAEPQCMWRHGVRTHFTASLVVLDESLEHVALTLHGKAKRWFQFGGHLEAGDASVRDAAAREGREESGLGDLLVSSDLVQVDAHALPPVFDWCREHLDLRYAAIARSGDLVMSDESDDVRWWPVDALPEGTEESLVEAIHLARENLSART